MYGTVKTEPATFDEFSKISLENAQKYIEGVFDLDEEDEGFR